MPLDLESQKSAEEIMQRMMSFLSGTVMGALVGATLAILFAPSSGEELRAEMQQRANRIQSEVKDAASSRRAELESQLAAMRTPQRPGM
jgi:gas vesicle protein